MKKRWIVVALLLPLFAASAFAQEAYIEMLRQDIKAEKVAIITEVMNFSDEEGAAFWPIYREYQLELDKLRDIRLQLIKEFAERYDTMTDTKAGELVDRVVKLDEDRLKLRKKYLKKFNKAIPTKTVAKYFQLERQINLLIDVQIASNLPLIK